MRKCTGRWPALVAGVLGVAGLAGVASAAAYSFNETFDAPPLTPGHTDFYEDGFVNGDNGWILIEQGAPNGNAVGGTNFGQRPVSFWPHNDDTQVSQVRVRSGFAEAYAIRDFATPLSSGNVTLKTAAYTVIGDISYSLRIASGGGATNAVQLDFGAPQAGTAANDYLRVQQVGGAGVTVADENTLTTAGTPLRWNINGFSTTSGDYAILSVDFDAATHQGTVNVTTVDASGIARSIAPVAIALDPSVTEIDRISLNANDVSSVNGSLSYLGNFSVTGETIPEPAMLSLVGLGGAALALRRARR